MIAVAALACAGSVAPMAGQGVPVPSLRLVDGCRLDSVVVELSVDMNGLSTCDVFQVTVEAPYGSEYLTFGGSEVYFLADDEALRDAGADPRNLKLTAVTPFRKDPRRMILLVDHTLPARSAGKAHFPDGHLVLGRFALACTMLGDYDKYKVRVVEGSGTTTFPIGKGRESATPHDCEPLVLCVSGGRLR